MANRAVITWTEIEFSGTLSERSQDIRITSTPVENTTVPVSVLLGNVAEVTANVWINSGAPSSSTSSDLRIQGTTLNDANTVPVTVILGNSQATSSDVRITGAAGGAAPPWSGVTVTYQTDVFVSADYNVRITGQQASANTSDTRITGAATSNATRDVRVTGFTTSNATRDIRVTGQLSSNRAQDTRLVGQADSNTTVSVNLTGTLFNPSSSEWNIRITGELPSNATRDIRIFGHQLTTNAVDVRTSGRATSVATNDVRLTSRQDNEFTFDIRLVGEAPSSKAVDARMVGTADTTYTQDLRLQAENTSSTETAVRIAGVIQTEREVRIVGGNLVASSFENDVWIIGKPVAQKARPDGVVSNDGWVAVPSGTLPGAVDEVVADDSDYMKSPTDPTTIKAVQLSLSDIFDPTSNEFHVVRYRVAAHMTPSITRLTVRLLQGDDEIAAWTHDDLTSTPQTFVQNLAEAQAATITDYSDLRLEFSVVNI